MTEASRPSSKSIGDVGERAARDYAVRIGWTILDHNVRWREGELDLIAYDRATLVFAEVKTLIARGDRSRAAFSPFESIDARKQRQVRSLARRWLVDELPRLRGSHHNRVDSLRFDAFAVTLQADGSVVAVEHLEDAF